MTQRSGFTTRHSSPAQVNARRARGGFTLVEVIGATLILAAGVWGLAGTSGLLVRRVTMGEIATQRAAAFQTAIERLRLLDWESVGSGSATEGRYAVSWWVAQDYAQSRVVKIVTRGPGLVTASGFPALHPSVADTFTYRLLRN